MAALRQFCARTGLKPGEQLVGGRRVEREPQMITESVEGVDHGRRPEGTHPFRYRGRDSPSDDGQVGTQQCRGHRDGEVGLIVIGQRQHAGLETGGGGGQLGGSIAFCNDVVNRGHLKGSASLADRDGNAGRRCQFGRFLIDQVNGQVRGCVGIVAYRDGHGSVAFVDGGGSDAHNQRRDIIVIDPQGCCTGGETGGVGGQRGSAGAVHHGVVHHANGEIHP